MKDPKEELEKLSEAEKDILRGIIRKQKQEISEGASAWALHYKTFTATAKHTTKAEK